MSKNTKIYSYNDLPESLKSMAIKVVRERSHEPDWDDEAKYIAGALEEDYGLQDAEINFTGFYSQGDGASFTGSVKDMDLFLSKTAPKTHKILVQTESLGKFDEVISIRFSRLSSNYYHENTCAAEINFYDYMDEAHKHLFTITREVKAAPGKWSAYLQDEVYFSPFGAKLYHFLGDEAVGLSIDIHKLQEEIEKWRISECKKIYRSLEKTNDYQDSDEGIEDVIEANDYKFKVWLDEDGDVDDFSIA